MHQAYCVMYGRLSIKAGYDQINNYKYNFAFVHPGGEISFPVDVDDEKVPRVKLSKAIEKIEDLAPDIVLSHMFCTQAPAYKGMMELLGIPLIGADSITMSNVLDKRVSRAVMESEGLPVPKGVVLNVSTDLGSLNRLEIEFPCVVKPTTCENSVGVTLVKNKLDLVRAVNLAFTYSSHCIIDTFIPGREVRISVIEMLDGSILPLPAFEYTEIGTHEIRTFEDKLECKEKRGLGFAKSGAAVRYLTEEQDSALIQRLGEVAIKAHIALNCTDFSQLDCRISETGEVFILECNVFCSLSPSSVVNKMYKELGHTDAELTHLMVQKALGRSGSTKKEIGHEV